MLLALTANIHRAKDTPARSLEDFMLRSPLIAEVEAENIAEEEMPAAPFDPIEASKQLAKLLGRKD